MVFYSRDLSRVSEVDPSLSATAECLCMFLQCQLCLSQVCRSSCGKIVVRKCHHFYATVASMGHPLVHLKVKCVCVRVCTLVCVCMHVCVCMCVPATACMHVCLNCYCICIWCSITFVKLMNIIYHLNQWWHQIIKLCKLQLQTNITIYSLFHNIFIASFHYLTTFDTPRKTNNFNTVVQKLSA